MTKRKAAATITPDGAGWHILANDGRLGNGDGRLVVPGEWMQVDGELEICERGMHWCPRLIDCLAYAQGSVICRVEASGTLPADEDYPDKRVSRHRRVAWMLTADDGERVLRVLARQCAIDVAYLWKPLAVVVEWLETGNEDKREAAGDAAWDALQDAALRDASRDAAVAAAVAASRAAARDAARDAAWYAARDAARDAAWYAARDAAGDAQNDTLERLAIAAHEGRWSDVAVTLPPTWAETRRKAGLEWGEQ